MLYALGNIWIMPRFLVDLLPLQFLEVLWNESSRQHNRNIEQAAETQWFCKNQ